MHSESDASTTSTRFVPRHAQGLLKPLAVILKTGDPAATADRFFDSKHVKDLRFIVAVGLLGVLLVFIFGSIPAFVLEWTSQWRSFRGQPRIWTYLRIIFLASNNLRVIFAPALAAFGALFAWAYQTGSARLGVVDLFACEITTLCRVVSVVDTVRRFVTAFDQGPPAAPAGAGQQTEPAHPYTAQEDYFPIFGSNTKDLETLEARVVINITAFYTYMKAVRDSTRALAEIGPRASETEPPSNDAPADRWHEAARNVVYMLFLGLESARHAVCDLVEFVPERAEYIIIILISELEAFRFLVRQYPDPEEVHHKRIILRAPEYRHLVQDLCHSVEAGRSCKKPKEDGTQASESQKPSEWEPAFQLLDELTKRYQAAMVLIHS